MNERGGSRRDGHMTVVGLMSGTSVDGVDAVVADFTARPDGRPGIRQRAFLTVPYPGRLRDEILAVASGEARSARDLCHLDHAVGKAFAEAAVAVLAEAGLAPGQVDLVGSHGQTLHHEPDVGETLQLGEPVWIAAAARAPVVSDFRRADMALGGQGAPLVPLFDALFLRHEDRGRALLNLGGIANVTVLPAGRGMEGVIAFDTGPGNLLVDEFVRRATGGKLTMDEGGRMAAAGTVDEELLAGFLEHPYFLEAPPKSTGREVFGAAFVGLTLGEWARRGESMEDLVATLTAFTAASVASAVHRFVLPEVRVEEMLVSGGGVHNATMMAWIARELPEVRVCSLESEGFSSDAKEALAFALLARETVCGRPGNVPAATGARGPAILGKVTHPPEGAEGGGEL